MGSWNDRIVLPGWTRRATAAVTAGALLANLSCGMRTVCRDPGADGVSRACVEQRIVPGNEIWVHTRDTETHHGAYVGTRIVDGAATLLLLPFSAAGLAERADTARIELKEIQRINRIQETPSFLAGILIGAAAGVIIFFLLIPGDLGLR